MHLLEETSVAALLFTITEIDHEYLRRTENFYLLEGIKSNAKEEAARGLITHFLKRRVFSIPLVRRLKTKQFLTRFEYPLQ